MVKKKKNTFVKVPSDFHYSLSSFVQKDISCEYATTPVAQHA